MKKAILWFVVLAFVIVGINSCDDIAQAATTTASIYVLHDILAERGSPMADTSWLIYYAAKGHPTLSVVDYLALTWAESSLGKGTMRHRNVGSIRGGKVGTIWRDLRTGTFGSGFNHYDNWYDGQRATIRLILERYNGSVMRGDGLHRWYGYGVPGWYQYRRNFMAARSILVREAAERGVIW